MGAELAWDALGLQIKAADGWVDNDWFDDKGN